MSVARQEFAENLKGVREAISLEPIAQGSLGAAISPGIVVLRRGMMVASLIALEGFIRDRTNEITVKFQDWPRAFDDLPSKLRMAARLEALGHLQKFSRVLKRQGEDYEAELRSELAKMVSGHGTVLQLTRFVAGDFTGNLSATGLGDLLKAFQVFHYWEGFRSLASDTGFGVPSVEEVVKNIVTWRHKSAHVPGYVPNASDIIELDKKLLCVAMCFDVALTAAAQAAIETSSEWLDDGFDWTKRYVLYLSEFVGSKYRISKYGAKRAAAIVDNIGLSKERLPNAGAGKIRVVVENDQSGLPTAWQIL